MGFCAVSVPRAQRMTFEAGTHAQLSLSCWQRCNAIKLDRKTHGIGLHTTRISAGYALHRLCSCCWSRLKCHPMFVFCSLRWPCVARFRYPPWVVCGTTTNNQAILGFFQRTSLSGAALFLTTWLILAQLIFGGWPLWLAAGESTAIYLVWYCRLSIGWGPLVRRTTVYIRTRC